MLSIVLVSCVVNKNSKVNCGQSKLNIELREKLETILLKDQGIREILVGNLSAERKVKLLACMNLNETDVEGNKKYILVCEIDSIIKIYGYPNKSLVGEPVNNSLFHLKITSILEG